MWNLKKLKLKKLKNIEGSTSLDFPKLSFGYSVKICLVFLKMFH